MRAELHDLFDENKHVYGIDYINSAWYFLRKYCIESLSVEALLKDYQRWRRKMRRKTSVREYKQIILCNVACLFVLSMSFLEVFLCGKTVFS